MKEAIGSTWLFQIVIIFIILFAGYMCLSINHSKAFAVKDDIIEIIERNNGVSLDDNMVSSSTSKEIASKLMDSGYRTNGNCSSLSSDSDKGSWVGFNREGKVDNNHATFCIRKVNVSGAVQVSNELPTTVYYQVAVFYQLDLPVLNHIMSFSVKGDTRLIYNPSEN